MTTYYLLKNQKTQYLTKSGEWIYAAEGIKTIYFSQYRDEAINSKIELTVKNADLRVEIVETLLDDRRLPVVADDDLFTPPVEAIEHDNHTGIGSAPIDNGVCNSSTTPALSE